HRDVELAVLADGDILRADTLFAQRDGGETAHRRRDTLTRDHLDRAGRAEADLGIFAIRARSNDAFVAAGAALGDIDIALVVDGQAARLVEPLSDDRQLRAFGSRLADARKRDDLAHVRDDAEVGDVGGAV